MKSKLNRFDSIRRLWSGLGGIVIVLLAAGLAQPALCGPVYGLNESSDGCKNGSGGADPAGGQGGPGCSSCSSGGAGGPDCCNGVPVWSVSEPYINVWVYDEPLGYQPGLGSHISFKLAYKQRDDLNGNLLSDGTRSFAYDDENQLISVWGTNLWRSDFAYDGKMRRRVRVESTWSGSIWFTNTIVRYAYDGNLVIEERWLNPQLLAQDAFSFTRGPDLSGTLQGAGGIGGLLARTDNGQLIAGLPSAHAYYHADGNGNILALINSIQAIVAKYLYDPFGNILSRSGSLADANLYRFSSKEYHPASGLVYYGYRFYDAILQRWLNRDPLGDFGALALQNWIRFQLRMSLPLEETVKGANVYEFVANGPTSAFDPFGLWQWGWPPWGNPKPPTSPPLPPSCPPPPPCPGFKSQWQKPPKIPPYPFGKQTLCLGVYNQCMDDCKANYGPAGDPPNDTDACLNQCTADCKLNLAKCMSKK